MNSWARRFALFCFLIVLVPDLPVAAQQASLCALPRFFEDTAALKAAADGANAKAGSEAVVICDEDTYVFDADSKYVHTSDLTYKVLSQRGAQEWDAISVRWEPWHDQKPTVRARVISADGTVHALDMKTLKDETASDAEEKIYSDGRILRGPLPAVAVGAIVEEEEIIAEKEPFFAAGTVERLYIGEGVPVLESRLLLDAPKSLNLKYEPQLLPDLKTERSEGRDRVKVALVQGRMEALDPAESNLPGDIPSHPAIAFSTGADWGSIAAKYDEIVDKQIADADLKAVVARVTQGKTTREEKAAALQEFVAKQVRYTGVEFGEAAIVPHSPEVTLRQQYGDCKDKSSLMVALLRAGDIPAYVALLNAGSRQDVPANLPGMGLFDHAIVYLPGTPDLWIDATDEYARLGQVPSADQSRSALIARRGVTELVRTPESSSKDNLVSETREFFLAENGPARIVEITQPHGVYESEFRAYYADAENKDVKKNLTDYVKDVYLADQVSHTERSNPKDLSKQFQLQIEANKAKRGLTELESAEAAIRLEWLFNRLPGELQEREKDEKKEDAAGDNAEQKPKKPRTQDYLLPTAFVNEWNYRIVPPAGFQAKRLPADRKVDAGPAVFEQQFHLAKDGAVEGTLRFDTAKRRLSVAEMQALRNGVVQLREQEPIMIEFELTAAALRSQGKMRESLQATRALIALHPKEGVHHLQMAQGLLKAGLGQPAREEARLAVKMEPGSALGEKTLAEILEYDTLGRKFRLGSDYAGATEAFRATEKLDPDDKTIRGNLAILLEYNKYGERYASDAPLKESIKEYESLKPGDRVEIGLANNLAYTCFYAGEFAEARKNAESLNPQPNIIMVATEAVLNGSSAAIGEARKRVSTEDDQKQLLRSAGDILMRVRKYPQAADLLELGAAGNEASRTLGLAAMLRKMTPHEILVFPDTPAGMVQKISASIAQGEANSELFVPLMSRNALKAYKNTDRYELEKVDKEAAGVRRTLSKTGYPADVMVDLTIQLLDIKTDGDDANGYRVSLRAANKNQDFYIVKEDGKYKLLDTSEKPNAVGLEILDRISAGNTAGARILLDWVRSDQHMAGGDDALAGYAFPRMWAKGKEGDARQMKLAAAALLCETQPTAEEGTRVLEATKADIKDDAEKLNVQLALLDGYGIIGKYDKTEEITTELAKGHPDSRRVFLARVYALRVLGKGADADKLAKNWQATQPDDLTAARTLLYNAAYREDYPLAYELAKKVLNSSQADASDYNNAAWYGLFTGKTGDLDEASGSKSLQMVQNSAGVLHTIGCVYAAEGKTKDAREVLLQTMEILNLEEPDSNYWYGFGRIAEQYGETASALEDYGKVTKPPKVEWISGSSYRLAQQRMAAMQKDNASKAN